MAGDVSFAPNELAGPAALAGALARLEAERAVSLPLLGARARRRLIGAPPAWPPRESAA